MTEDFGAFRATPSIPGEPPAPPVVSGPAPETAIITGFFGMKCDTPGCSWSDMTVQRSEYLSYRNKPCPNCGANLLTDEDWNLVLSMEAAAKWVNENAERLGINIEEPGEPFDLDFDEVKSAVLKARTAAETGSVGTPQGVNQNKVIP